MAVIRLVRIVLSGVLFSLMLTGAAVAAEPCQTVVGRLATVDGQVEVQRTGASSWQAVVLGAELCQGDTVRAAARSRATITLINQAVLRVDQNTAMRLDNITGVTEERSVLSLLKGTFQSFSRKPRGFEVNTPYLNGSIEGTEFVFRVEDGQSDLTVLEGTVIASNDQGNVSVSGGESAVAEQGKAPTMRTVVRPRDAVQWSLYYPPVMAAGGETAGVQTSLKDAASLLSVGRVDEAQASINDALQQNPNDGLAYALRAVINVVQNNNEQALVDGNKAVALSPNSSAAKIALSYAQQAAFDIQAAHDTLQQAVQQQPQDALALARLAELQLMLGDRKQSRESARQAAALDPMLSRTQLILGFAALAEFDNEEAKAAFKSAIDLSSSDPLAHLGLGLAKISDGEVEAGGRDIEVAVALDSNSALLRAYLGKTYFEEKRTPLDTEQFAIAKQLDPNDPTAYLYDGIAKQTENRPVEAVHDLEQSIALNDNRAVYRSRLLLDKDRAARGTSLARAYKDLGFTQLGVNASTDSLAVDPSNASAHRFLADTYSGTRRHETARVSELLQAQLMQDVNINPIQPSVSATNLNIVTIGGPATPGFDEFTPLFQRNTAQLNATGFGGNNDTNGGEAVVSALYGGLSLSAGGFHYKSDGWRDNNDVEENIYNVFAQWAVSPVLNLQAEFRHRETEEGDLAFNFDPDDFVKNKSVDRDQDMARFGLRFSPSTRWDVLFSYIYSDINEERHESEMVDEFTTLKFDFESDTTGYITEGQVIFHGEHLKLVSGAAYSEPDTDEKDSFTVDDVDFGIVFQDKSKESVDTEQKRPYMYAYLQQSELIDWTLGASYDDFEEGELDKTSFNPKLGLQWNINNSTWLRAAAFKMLKPTLISRQTIEPTQVAGFNQLYDDPSGTKYWRYGLGLDSRISKDLSVGAEATWRDLDEPVDFSGKFVTEDRNEQLHKLYLYWTPLEQLAVSAEIVYDQYESEDGVSTSGGRPKEVQTYSAPVSVSYFRPSGLFATIGGTYVDQEVDRENGAFISSDGQDNFFLVDASVGYRLPKRRGVVSLGVSNLFDKEFNYQDDSYREFSQSASTGPYFPERIVQGRVTLNF